MTKRKMVIVRFTPIQAVKNKITCTFAQDYDPNNGKIWLD